MGNYKQLLLRAEDLERRVFLLESRIKKLTTGNLQPTTKAEANGVVAVKEKNGEKGE